MTSARVTQIRWSYAACAGMAVGAIASAVYGRVRLEAINDPLPPVDPGRFTTVASWVAGISVLTAVLLLAAIWAGRRTWTAGHALMMVALCTVLVLLNLAPALNRIARDTAMTTAATGAGFLRAALLMAVISTALLVVTRIIGSGMSNEAQAEQFPTRASLLTATTLAVVLSIVGVHVLSPTTGTGEVHTAAGARSAAARDIPDPLDVGRVAYRLDSAIFGLAYAGPGFVTSGNGGLIAYDGATGTQRWRRAVSTSRYGYGSPRFDSTDDGKVVVVRDRGTVTGVDGATGRQLWHLIDPAVLVGVGPFDGGTVYVLRRRAATSELLALDVGTGKRRWSQATSIPAECDRVDSAIGSGFLWISTSCTSSTDAFYSSSTGAPMSKRFVAGDVALAPDGLVWVRPGARLPDRADSIVYTVANGGETTLVAPRRDQWITVIGVGRDGQVLYESGSALFTVSLRGGPPRRLVVPAAVFGVDSRAVARNRRGFTLAGESRTGSVLLDVDTSSGAVTTRTGPCPEEIADLVRVPGALLASCTGTFGGQHVIGLVSSSQS
ncbi:PQQ-binding-like beta-propeller repeat protein [Williamsia sp. CHRR-6]|uniref:outer membrane protein assembly factor BamB family protein n=1 Tax=Williamsia sp. CHRR-6 TaxID=2835871 RepID=UPI001BDA31A5|nr:PQQ-binding-like beta-propeller repeat protein [Williamsia sp. CHRR-6]MBT0567293.1 PQQ-binding-like beta-propeller repeat protein [Williamsia sp. CHRR-6]